MPQMAPIWWTTIMLVTLLMMMILMIINYFSLMKKINPKNKLEIKKFNWKWY